MFAPDVLGPAVRRLAALADGGRALEFAIGTGRVAIPLAERGVPGGGRFVIELGVPELRKLPLGERAVVFTSEPGYIGVDPCDVLNQHLVAHHFSFGAEGRRAELGRWPAELDLMAELTGFGLESRHADWGGSEFTAESWSHVSVYRLPPAEPSRSPRRTNVRRGRAPAGGRAERDRIVVIGDRNQHPAGLRHLWRVVSPEDAKHRTVRDDAVAFLSCPRGAAYWGHGRHREGSRARVSPAAAGGRIVRHRRRAL